MWYLTLLFGFVSGTYFAPNHGASHRTGITLLSLNMVARNANSFAARKH